MKVNMKHLPGLPLFMELPLHSFVLLKVDSLEQQRGSHLGTCQKRELQAHLTELGSQARSPLSVCE